MSTATETTPISSVATPAPHKTVTDSALQHFLQHELSTNPALPKPSPNTLYFIYTPPGVAIVQGGGSSCKAFCGYHSNIGNSIFYAPMPYAGCLGGMSALDALSGTSSHELCEAITDAIPGTGWYEDNNGEIGAWKFKKLGPWNVQSEWSNKAGRCV